MATNSKIEWTDHTFNPWRGCTKVSAGCAHCYAETMSKRNPKSLGIWGDAGTRVIASESGWREPLKWNREAEASVVRARVFCGSMCDICEDRPELIEPRIRLKRLIEATPNLDWLLLSKRPENYLRLFDNWLSDQWPSNVWAGTSCEDQKTADERIPHLLRVPAAIRFLSLEPLLGPIDLENIFVGRRNPDGSRQNGMVHSIFRWPGARCVDWIIVGGESGPKARPCNIDWIRSIVRQCEEASVSCFVKQLGSRPVDGSRMAHDEDRLSLRLNDRKGGDPAEWPEDLRVREMPRLPQC